MIADAAVSLSVRHASLEDEIGSTHQQDASFNTEAKNHGFVSVSSRRKVSNDFFNELKMRGKQNGSAKELNEFYLPKSIGRALGLPQRERKPKPRQDYPDWKVPKVYDLGDGVSYSLQNNKPPIYVKNPQREASGSFTASTSVAGNHGKQASMDFTDQDFTTRFQEHFQSKIMQQPRTSLSKVYSIQDEASIGGADYAAIGKHRQNSRESTKNFSNTRASKDTDPSARHLERMINHKLTNSTETRRKLIAQHASLSKIFQ